MTYFILLAGGTWQICTSTKQIQQLDISSNRAFINKNLKVGLPVFDVFNANEISNFLKQIP